MIYDIVCLKEQALHLRVTFMTLVHELLVCL